MIDLLGALVRTSSPSTDRFGLDVVLPAAMQLSVEAGNELGKAGIGIRSPTSDVVPPSMNKGAANTAGAHYKAAFWLARASRMAKFWSTQQGASSEWFHKKAGELYFKAFDEKSAGDVLTALSYNPLVLTPVSQSAESIRQIFDAAAEAAMNVSPQPLEVATILRGLGTPAMTSNRQAEAAISSGFTPAAPSIAGRIWQKTNVDVPLAWLGGSAKEVVKLVFDQFIRPASEQERQDAKRAAEHYASTARNTRLLEEIKAAGVRFSPEEDQEVEKSKSYLAALANPMAWIRRELKMPPVASPLPKGSSDRFGFFVVDDAAAALGVTSTTVIVVTGIALAILIVAFLLAWSAERDLQTKKLLDSKLDALTACASNPNLSEEQRRKCVKLASELLGNQDYSSMLWAGAAVVALGVGAYTLGPVLREASIAGASELERWKLARIEESKLGRSAFAQVPPLPG